MEHLVSGWLGAVIGILVWRWWRKHHRRIQRWWEKRQTRRARRWRPKSEEACPQCRAGVEIRVAKRATAVEPYSQGKKKQGRPKALSSAGYACPCRSCRYFGVTDATVHALVGYGKSDQQHTIQRWRCQACKTTFSCRRGTPLYYLKSAPSQIELVLWFLAEGVDRSVLVRYTGRCDATLARWLERAGRHSQTWHSVVFQCLTVALVQMDEICVRMRGLLRFRWLWLAIDPVSKAILALHLGGRRAEDAQTVVHEVKGRLAPDCVPGFTTDGLLTYFYGLTAHFGRWKASAKRARAEWEVDDRLLYGQLVKRRHKRQVVFTTMRMLWGQRHQLTALLTAHGFSASIQTAFIERLNLTLRQSIALLTRKTWSLPRCHAALLLHVEWWRAYYHFLRPHQSLQGKTPAMALGVTDHVWSLSEFLRTPLIQ